MMLCLQGALLVLLVDRAPALLALALGSGVYLLFGAMAREASDAPAASGRTGGRFLLFTLALAALGTWSILVSQGIFYAGEPRTVWLRLVPGEIFGLGDPPGLYVYREGLAHGLLQSLRFDVMIFLGAGLLARYAADEMTAALRVLRVPATLCFLFGMALRFVPLLAEEIRQAWLSSRLRGLRPWGGRLFTPLLAGNLRRSDEISAALNARGFGLDTGWETANPERHGPGALQWALCLAGGVAVAGLAGVLISARLERAGLFSLPEWQPFFEWVVRHV